MSGPGAAERYTIPGNVTLVGLNFGPDVPPAARRSEKELPRHMVSHGLSTIFDPPSEVGVGTCGGRQVGVGTWGGRKADQTATIKQLE